MSRQTRLEIIRKCQEEYRKSSSRRLKAIWIDHLVRMCGYSRKHAIRVLRRQGPPGGKKRGRKPVYGEEELKHLKALWFASGQMCSKRLKAALPLWMGFYPRLGEMGEETQKKLLKMSPSTMDRLLRKARTRMGLGTTDRNEYFRKKIPIQPKDWNVTKPGQQLQADTVAHCGTSTKGEYVNTLTLTDIFSTWTENRAIWGKSGERTTQAIADVEKRLPFRMEGFKSDNGTEFLNYHLERYLTDRDGRKKPVNWVRSRPYKKDDQCYVEQKNYTHVRELFGYERFERRHLTELMNEIYVKIWNPLNNYFCPSIKLVRKERIGGHLKKTYDTPKTPYQRLEESADLSTMEKERLREVFESLNPFELQHELTRKLRQFFKEFRRTRSIKREAA